MVDLACKNGNFCVPTFQVCQQPNEPFDHALEVEKELMTEPPFLTFCIRGLLAGHTHCHIVLMPLTNDAEYKMQSFYKGLQDCHRMDADASTGCRRVPYSGVSQR